MTDVFDEISLSYWNANKDRGAGSKSYTCDHNGFVYGDDMPRSSRFCFVFSEDGTEDIIWGKNTGPKWAYIAMVEKACSRSKVTLDNFLNNRAKKFRIYTEKAVESFTPKERSSTRIQNEDSAIYVDGRKYYVAVNLKICEYINSAAKNIDPDELGKWSVRVYCDPADVKPMKDRDEEEDLGDVTGNDFDLTVTSPPRGRYRSSSASGGSRVVNIDFLKLASVKKKIGDFGEKLVLNYEKDALLAAGRKDLAGKVEHSSVVTGDGLGYDIQSFFPDGTPKYIEVKTTKQDKPAEFYLSKKEKKVADQMFRDGKKYLIYRIYGLNIHTGKGSLVIYEPPFDDTNYDMEPENWLVKADK